MCQINNSCQCFLARFSESTGQNYLSLSLFSLIKSKKVKNNADIHVFEVDLLQSFACFSNAAHSTEIMFRLSLWCASN